MQANTVRTRATGLLLVALLLLLAGCSRPSVVGKWSGNLDLAKLMPVGPNTLPVGMSPNIALTMEFKPDNTLTQVAKAPFGDVPITGTYKVDGDRIEMHLEKATMMGRTMNLPSPQQPQSSTFKVEGDTLTITRNGQPVTFTRVKE